MDRTLKIFKRSGHLFAEIEFYYEWPKQAKAHCQEYRQLYEDNDPDDESKSVYPGMDMDHYVDYKEFKTIDEIKAFDRAFAKKVLYDMKDPGDYTYVYDEQPVLHRYVIANHQGTIGMMNVYFSFINNTKEIKFLSAAHPRFDFDVSANSLETNMSCMLKIPWYLDREVREFSPHDFVKLPAWY